MECTLLCSVHNNGRLLIHYTIIVYYSYIHHSAAHICLPNTCTASTRSPLDPHSRYPQRVFLDAPMRFAVVADLPGAGRVGQTRSLHPVALLDLGADHHARVQIHAILQLSSQRFRLPFNEADVGQAPRLARLGSPADHRLVERDVLAQRLDSSTILFLVDSRRATAPHAHVPRHKEDERFGDVVCEDARERDVLSLREVATTASVLSSMRRAQLDRDCCSTSGRRARPGRCPSRRLRRKYRTYTLSQVQYSTDSITIVMVNELDNKSGIPKLLPRKTKGLLRGSSILFYDGSLHPTIQ